MSENRKSEKLGFQTSGWFGRLTYSFVNPLLRRGTAGAIDEDTAAQFFPDADHAEPLSTQFEAAYAAATDASRSRPKALSPASLVWAAFWSIYRWKAAEHLAWGLLEVAVRVGNPLLLRKLLEWFTLSAAGGSAAAPVSQGWMWASACAVFAYSYVAVHHQLFWRGMRLGMRMRLQSIAAVEAKVLRLNAVAVSDSIGGRIVNIVSNDVRRFDEAGTFWVFLIAGPIELIVVLVLVGLRLGFAASVAGVATLLLLIPSQAVLARYIGYLRGATAGQTDERVRLTGEAISGILACKMLAWEGPLLRQLRGIREKEAGFIRRMNAIRALNMAFSYAITPVVSLITFATARATGAELTVPNVFYSLALLSLPKLYMCEFFVHAVECVSELRVGVRRLGEFLATPEPPPPWHDQQQQQKEDKEAQAQNGTAGDGFDDSSLGLAVVVRKSDFHWGEAADQKATTKAAAAAAVAAPVSSTGVPTVMVVKEQEGLSPADGPNEEQNAEVETASAAATPRATLPGLSLGIRRGELVAIVGPVGAGKSSILSVLLGELQPSRIADPSLPAVEVRGSVAYCQQIPWIMSGTVRENILFGLPYEEGRYEAAVGAAALEEDLRAMPAGDATEIGERGISISGGQKARLSLARAAYSGAEVQLMDDPLSAVDPRVGRILFEKCIGGGGVMAGSTRVLVTHQRQYLPRCDRILVVLGGRVVEGGTHAELAAKGVPEVMAVANDTALDHAASIEETDDDAEPKEIDKGGKEEGATAAAAESSQQQLESVEPGQESPSARSSPSAASDAAAAAASATPRSAATFGLRVARFESMGRMLSSVRSMRRHVAPGGAASSGMARSPSAGYLRRFISTKLGPGGASAKGGNDADADDVEMSPPGKQLRRKGGAGGWGRSGKLIVKEDRAEGSVTWAVYGQLLKRLGIVPVALCVSGLLCGQAVYLYGEYWLSLWASKDAETQQEARWVWVYAIFAVCVLLISIVRAQLFFWASLRAASALHDTALDRLLHAPLSFFHTNPTGRILNRFSKDQGSIDEQLPTVTFDTLQALMMVTGAFTLLVIVVPFILPVFIPLGCAFFYVQRRYLTTSRDLKRFEAVTRSPLYAAFSATLKGLPTIRAYRAASRFRADFLSLLSANGAWWFSWLTCARWIGFRLDLLVAMLLTVAPLLMMAVHQNLSPRLVGLALTQSLYLAGMLQWMVRQAAEVENNMTSAERLLSYCELEQEEGGDAMVPSGWPPAGALRYQGVTAVYRPGLPSVLRNLSFDLPGGVSCGVVGRTGSGKSSLMLTLFRLIPVTEGNIYLDGVDTASVPLDTLRRQVAIIPQDPVLFSGTLRSNLDPWDQFGDAELWAALATAQLSSAASALGGLDARMQECGDNLSAGQRQLLCLARALLQDAAVLALDEATANVDRTTDAVIQQAVREACRGGEGRRGRTLLVIAHRIDTIMDCDQLLVLSGGELVENGPPAELMASGGTFAKMVSAAKAAHAAPMK